MTALGARGDRQVRIGVLSLDHHHAEGYLAALATMADVELVGLWDGDEGRARATAATHRIASFSSADALLAERPDGVLVCSVNSRHRPLVEAAAGAAVHVLCEKPLATTVEDARSMVETCAAAGTTLMTAFPMRTSPPVQALEASLRAGALGDVVCLEGVNTGEMPDVHRPWFVDPLLAGGGAIADHVVHLVDLYRWLLASEVVEVYAVANRILQGHTSAVETGGLVSLRFENRAFATIDCSWSKPRSYPTWGGLDMEVIGTRGAVTVDAFAQHLIVYGDAASGASVSFWGTDPNAGMLAEFVAAIRESRPAAITGVDGLRAVEVVDAAYRSITAGQPVSVALTPVPG